ncbi:MAG: glycosyltransferase [Planctomycetota bacterium]
MPPDTDKRALAIKPLQCSAVLTHHWLVRPRGGEKVLEALCELLPDCPLYTLVHDPAGFNELDNEALRWWGQNSARIVTSFLQKIPGGRRHYPKLLPLMPMAARRMKLPPADLVVCSDAAIAKAMTPHAHSKVVCYCHSPVRYAWEPEIAREYRATLPLPLRPLWGITTARIRRADYRAAQRVDQFVANSRHVAERIRRHYGRESVVVHPPVEIPTEPTSEPRGDYYLCVGYHVPYKRLDLAIAACAKLGRRLVVIGEGPDVARLRSVAGPLVEWCGWQQAEAISAHYRRARALLFPGEEDFGIVPVEAMAHGCPVVAYAVGGATETVTDRRTGVLFKEQIPAALAAAMEQVESLTFDPAAMHADMQKFSRARFLGQMRDVLVAALGDTDTRSE